MILNVEEFLKENGLKDETQEDCDFDKVYKFPVYLRDSKKSLKEVWQISIMDNSEVILGLIFTWKMKDIKSFHFDSFGGSSDNFFAQQLPKPITSQI